MLNKITEAYDEEFLTADGFNEAVIGVEENSMRLIYSVSKCLNILTTVHRMSQEEAIEYLNYNVVSAYVGEKTPIWCNDLF